MSDHHKKIWTKDFIYISLTQFILFLAFYTLLTTLPIYVIQELGGTEAQGGLVVTSMLIAAIIMRPFSGNLLEKIGKRKGLLWSTFLFTVTLFFYYGVHSFLGLIILRFIHGLSFGVLTTVTSAIAADVVPEERRGAGLGYFAMSMNIAMVVGPFIGLTLLQFVSFHVLFVITSLIMVIGLVSAFRVQLPAVIQETTKTVKRKLSIHDLVEIKAIPIAGISLFVGIAYSSILSYISVFAEAMDLTSVGSYFFVVFAVVMILTRPSLGQLFDVKGPTYVIVPCLLIFSVGLIMLSYTTSSWMFLLTAAVIGLGSGALLPSFQTMCIQAADKGRSGHATATFFIFWDTGIATGSYVLGMIVAMFNFHVLYISCACLLILVLGLFLTVQVKQDKKATGTELA
ncbi:MFS transporter [Ornithinibacillus contaminans]|uniref:MFS transporter n=1 Tax=Ornithinibacillus contaminans TaxID=694055 RepID=UPI00064DA6A9|nr:MFS transporter [Ornithinibacillus contaminans]